MFDERPAALRLVAAASLGVYAVVAAGATTAVTEAARACRTWPTCGGQWVNFGTLDLALVTGHRAAAAITGVLVVLAAIAARRAGEPRRVRVPLLLSAVGYPIQIALGAAAATGTLGSYALAGHLALGLAIFGALLVALARSLEREPTGLPTASKVDSDPGAPRGGVAGTALAYLRLTKPRLMWLLCLVATAAMALSAGRELAPRTVGLTLLGGVLAIGASGTFNHVFEREKDEQMARTSDRPVVRDRVPVRNALAFGLFLGTAAVGVFLQVNALVAGLGLLAILFYAVGYTLLLKPNTDQNTVVGGFAGSLPALIGSAAVTETIDLPGLALAAIVFLWTPAHFYNLALAYRDDYERGGFPMLPVVRGERVTRKHIVLYLGATLAATAALPAVAPLGALYVGVAVVAGGAFLWAAVRIHHEHTRRAVFRSFHASNAFLGAVLAAAVLDSLLV